MSNWMTIEVSSLLMLFATQMSFPLGALWVLFFGVIIFFGHRIHPFFAEKE